MVKNFREWLRLREAPLDPARQQQIIGTIANPGGGNPPTNPAAVADLLATSNVPLTAAMFNSTKALAVDAAAKQQQKKINPQSQQNITNTSLPASMPTGATSQ